MAPKYLHLTPDQAPPQLMCGPFLALIVSEAEVTQEWRNRIAAWLVESRCLYVVAWGIACEQWHDAVDWTVLAEFDYGDVPDDRHIMTTWHPDEPLSEAMWFVGHCAYHPDIELADTVMLHIANQASEADLLETYVASPTMPEDR